jgi:two-component system, chemotaxis family, CheB/CheR fusion protein
MSETRDPEFERFLAYLASSRGSDFSGYKRSSLVRRTRARMAALQLETFADYIDRLDTDPGEFAHLFDMLLINVTAFYRDLEPWEYLQREIVPQILEDRSPSDPIRVWSAGCASGEEAFTLALVFAEVMGIEQAARRLKIYATDLDENALATARHGTYSDRHLEGLPEGIKERYFQPSNGHYIIHPDLRRVVIFGRHDLMQDAPISRLDLLSCRNTLMYFNSESQQKILQRFFFALNDGGYLFLGKAETLLMNSPAVDPVQPKFRIFRKRSRPTDRNHVLTPAGATAAAPDGDSLVLDGRIRQAVFDVDLVAQLVVDSSGALALANQKAREMFRLTARDIGRPLQDLELSYRPVELRSLLDQLHTDQKPIPASEATLVTPSGERRWYSLTLMPITEGQQLLGAKIIFEDITRFKELEADLQRSRGELETAYEELQSANEELETTNEELQSTVEELETTNEELQSTNEELETMNEELQSTNEELEALNDALQERTEALNATNDFLESILRSLSSAVIVFDRELKVEVWSNHAEEQWGLRADEVRGRYLPNLDIGLPVDHLFQAIREAMADSGQTRNLTLAAVNRRGRRVECDIAVTPRLQPSGEVAGAILVIDERELPDGGAPRTISNP